MLAKDGLLPEKDAVRASQGALVPPAWTAGFPLPLRLVGALYKLYQPRYGNGAQGRRNRRSSVRSPKSHLPLYTHPRKQTASPRHGAFHAISGHLVLQVLRLKQCKREVFHPYEFSSGFAACSLS
jgi:hypothetical protein